jgi:putative acyl-CoA dehydrogenase
MPRLYREAPLNSIWEGSGNVICLDILRALGREPASRAALVDELQQIRGIDLRHDAFTLSLEANLMKAGQNSEGEGQARRLAEQLALALQAALMIRYSSPAMTEAFLDSRLRHDHGYTFGTLPSNADTAAILG